MAETLHCDPMDFITSVPLSSPPALPPHVGALLNQIYALEYGIGALLLGSRASGAASPGSDWDIGITHVTATLTSKRFLQFKHMADEAEPGALQPLDLIWLDNAPGWFLKTITHPLPFLGGSRLAALRFIGKLEILNGK